MISVGMPTVFGLQIFGIPKTSEHLLKAAKTGDISTIKACYKSGVDINVKNAYGNTPLHLAALNGHTKVIEVLAKLHANIEAQNDEGRTPLYKAVIKGRLNAVKILKDVGANLEACDKYGKTVLQWATSNGFLETVKVLKQLGAQSAMIDINLDKVAKLRDLEAIRILKMFGSNYTPSSDENFPILDSIVNLPATQAIESSDTFICTQTSATIDDRQQLHATFIENSPSINLPSLHYAAINGNIEAIKNIANLNKDLEIFDEYKRTALHHAVEHSQIEAIKVLKNLDANLEAKDRFGLTPLHYAARQGHVQSIITLYELGADLEAYDHFKHTPLHWAAGAIHVEAIKVLKKLGANLNAIDGKKWTPLFWALHKNYNLGDAEWMNYGGFLMMSCELKLYKPSHTADHDKQAEVIKTLKDLGSNLEVKDEDGLTPLHWAARDNQIEIIDLLYKLGVDLEVKDEHGLTCLHWAVRQIHLDTIKILLSLGANLEAHDALGCTPLHWAVEGDDSIYSIPDKDLPDYSTNYDDQIKVIRSLKKLGANLEAQESSGLTALHWAVRRNRIKIIEALCELGANLEARDKDGYTPLHYAAQMGCIKAICVLYKYGANLEAQCHKGFTPLYSIVSNGHLERAPPLGWNPTSVTIEKIKKRIKAIKVLKELGANVRTINKQNKSPIHSAAARGEIKIIKVLIKLGADLEAQDDKGFTPLHYAIQNLNQKAITVLNDLGAKINAVDKSGATAMHIIATSNGGPWALIKDLQMVTNIIRTLKSFGAHIDAQDKTGATPLHRAAAEGRLEAIKALIELGSNLKARDKTGATPLYLAAVHGQVQAIVLFIELGINLDSLDQRTKTILEHHNLWNNLNLNLRDKDKATPLHRAAVTGKVEVIETLKKLGANLKPKDKYGATPLHLAALHGQVKSITIFYKFGMNFNIQSNDGSTPLHFAVLGNCIDAIKKLKKLGAKIDISNNLGHTPYMTGLLKKYNFKELLCDEDIDGVLENGLTQLGIAACNGDVKMLEILIAYGANILVKDSEGYTAEDRSIEKGQIPVMQFFMMLKNSHSLKIAAANGNINSIAYYLNLGADINNVDGQGHCAAYYAAFKGHLEIFPYLVECGADLGLLDKNDLGLLWVLLPKYEASYLALFKDLVALQNDVMGVDDQKRNLLHVAARYADIALVEFLLELHLDYKAQDASKQTALHWAAQNPDETVFRYIIDFLVQHCCQYILDIRDFKGETALHTVARFGTTEMIGLCEEYQCDFAARNNREQTPKDVAQEANRSGAFLDEIAKEDHWIGSRDTNPDFVETVNTEQLCSNGMMPLEEAITKGKIPPVCYWVAQKADLEPLDKNSLTFLRTVLKEYKDAYRNCLITLLALQTDIHQPDGEGATLLHLAARYADMPALKILLDMGMDLNAVDHAGQTVLHKAILNPNCTVFRYLAQTYPTLLSIRDAQGETVVHIAARLGSPMMITLCKAYGLDFGARNNLGQRPLEVAIQTKQPQAVITQIQACTGAAELALADTQEDVPAVWSACDQARTQLAIAGVTVQSNHTQEAEVSPEHELILLGDLRQVDQDLLLPEDSPDDDDEGYGGGAALWAVEKMAW